MDGTRYGTAYTAPDHGICAECGLSVMLRQLDGYVRQHDHCPGGGQPPAKIKTTETIHLPDDGQE